MFLVTSKPPTRICVTFRTSFLARKIFHLVTVSVISDGGERKINADQSRAHNSKINISEVSFSK